MAAADEFLGALRLDASGFTVTTHVINSRRTTLEVFAAGGELVYVATTSPLAGTGLCAAWTVFTRPTGWAIVALGATNSSGALPTITFSHRGRQVRGQLYRLGPFWLGEAGGRRLRLDVDDGEHRMTTRSRWRPGALPLRHETPRLAISLRPPLEIN